MRVVVYLASVAWLLFTSVFAQCPTTTRAVISITTSRAVAVTSATRAVIGPGGTATIGTCGQGLLTVSTSVQASPRSTIYRAGLMYIDGGSVSLSGETGGFSGSCTAYAIGPALIATATRAAIIVNSGAAATVQTANNAGVTINAGGVATVLAGTSVFLTAAAGATGYITGFAATGRASGFARMTNLGGRADLYAGLGATVSATGNFISGGVRGVATVQGDFYSLQVQYDASVSGASGTIRGYYGGQAIVTGSGGALVSIYADAGYFGMVSIGGMGNVATMEGYTVRQVIVDDQATARIMCASADITLGSDVSDVQVEATDAVVTMKLGATVSAISDVIVTATSPQTAIVSIGEAAGRFGDPLTIYAARLFSGARRRAEAPLPTPRCASDHSTICPGLNGGWNCIDIMSDIFNCGGCADQGGIDCTTLSDDEVRCDNGRCISVTISSS